MVGDVSPANVDADGSSVGGREQLALELGWVSKGRGGDGGDAEPPANCALVVLTWGVVHRIVIV